MRKINLLYVITKLELGGAQKQLLSLINRLDKQRFRIHLFTSQEGFLSRDVFSIDGLRVKKSRWLERPIRPLKDIFVIFEISRFIKKNNIDIVHTHSSKAGILGRWAAKISGVKVILHTVHGWSFNDYQPRWKQKFFSWLERISAKFTDKLIVVSEYDKRKGLYRRIGEKEKYHLIRYGIDYDEFSKRKEPDFKKELGMDPNSLVIGMISCFKPQKAPDNFIKLAALVKRKMPDVKFLLVGDGILRRDIERQIKKSNLENSVILTGWRRDIPRILSILDVFVLTSLWEGLPISVLEAMATNLPVVVTHTGGIAEVVAEGKNGFLFFPFDMKSMSEKVVSLLKDDNLRNRLGQNARDSLDFKFHIDNLVRNSQDLYENLVKIGAGKGCDN